MKFVELEQQLELPQEQLGVDYGARRPVLLRKGNRVLAVEPGHSFWGGIGVRSYGPTIYVLATVDGSDPFSFDKELFGGRLSKAKVAAAAPRIAEWLGCAIEDLPAIHRRKTFVWQGARS